MEASRRELAELADASADELQIADDARSKAETERDEALERMRTADAVKAQAEVRTAEAEERADAAEAEAERLLEESEERGRRLPWCSRSTPKGGGTLGGGGATEEGIGVGARRRG